MRDHYGAGQDRWPWPGPRAGQIVWLACLARLGAGRFGALPGDRQLAAFAEPDVEAILAAWRERQVTRHLIQLANVRDRGDSAVNGWKQCSRPTRSSPTIGPMALSSRQPCTAARTCRRRSGNSSASSKT